MKLPTLLLTLITCFITTAAHAQTKAMRPLENISIEGASIELLHNQAKGAGTAIVRPLNCEKCEPVQLNYTNPVTIRINGFLANTESITRSQVTTGDISYEPDTLAITNINFYQ
jgi:hypothetical protein